jgi:hypothetical protein
MSWVDLTSSKKVKEGKTKMATAGLGVYKATRINGEVIVTEGLADIEMPCSTSKK